MSESSQEVKEYKALCLHCDIELYPIWIPDCKCKKNPEEECDDKDCNCRKSKCTGCWITEEKGCDCRECPVDDSEGKTKCKRKTRKLFDFCYGCGEKYSK